MWSRNQILTVSVVYIVLRLCNGTPKAKTLQGSSNPIECKQRTEPASRCRKQCTTDKGCRRRRGREKKCLCDGECGSSCIRIGMRCTNAPPGKPRNGEWKYTSDRFGSTVTYKCKKGYTLVGPSKVTCSGIGKWKPWDQGHPECKKLCPTPETLKDGRNIGRTSQEVGSVINFICNPGYDLTGSNQITCQRDLTWSSPIPKCLVKNCIAPPVIENAMNRMDISDTFYYGRVISYRCNPGYSGQGSRRLTCGINGWSNTQFRCHPVSCGNPGDIYNGRKYGTRYSFKSIVRYVCNNGYLIQGSANRRCQANQRWSGKKASCKVIDCWSPMVPNGEFKGIETTFGSIRVVKCSAGYLPGKIKSISCGNDGTWRNLDQVKCLSISGSWSKWTVWSPCSTTCNVGNQTRKRHCERSASSQTKRPCIGDGVETRNCNQNNFCPGCHKDSVPLFDNGRFIRPNDDYQEGDSPEYKCGQGYQLKPSVDGLRCLNNKWNGTLPFCERTLYYKGCHVRPHKVLYHKFRPMKQYDTIMTCMEHCQSQKMPFIGFYGRMCYCIRGGLNEKTKNEGYCYMGCWYDDDQSCGGYADKKLFLSIYETVPTCNIPPITDRLALVAGSNKNGSKGIYRCYGNYYLDGDSTTVCIDGRWTGNKPKCRALYYKGCYVRPHKVLYHQFRPMKQYDTIMTCMEHCQSQKMPFIGFYGPMCYCIRGGLNGKTKNEGYCYTGCWYDDDQSCGGYANNKLFLSIYETVPTCNIPPITDRLALVAGSNKNGSKGIYRCYGNYYLDGDSTTVCIDGRWTGNKPKCRGPCPVIKGFSNGKVTYQPISKLHGSKAILSCNPGWKIFGREKILTCSYGKWIGTMPRCQRQ